MFKQTISPSTALSESAARGDIIVQPRKTSVSVHGSPQGHDMAAAVIAAAQAATDFRWLKNGQAVFIKTVNNSGFVYPATTSPIAVSAMIKLLKEKGAGRVIVGDMSGIQHLQFFEDKTTGSTRDLMKKSGMLQAIEAAGGEPFFFEADGWDSFYPDHTDTNEFWNTGLMMPAILKQADHIVLMPRCSRHVLTGSSLGLKAVVGYWRTDTRLHYHYHGRSLQERTAEGNRAKTLLDKQRLVISTGDKLLATFGPDRGYVHAPPVGLVIASESVVAHDMVSLAWLLHNRTLLPRKEQGRFMDTSAAVAKLGNSIVVKWLGTLANSLMSESLVKNDLTQVWDDRVLNHAYKIFGGIPDIHLENIQNTVSEKMLNTLLTMVRY